MKRIIKNIVLYNSSSKSGFMKKSRIGKHCYMYFSRTNCITWSVARGHTSVSLIKFRING